MDVESWFYLQHLTPMLHHAAAGWPGSSLIFQLPKIVDCMDEMNLGGSCVPGCSTRARRFCFSA